MKEIYLMVKDDAQGMYVIESGKKYPLGPGGSDKPPIIRKVRGQNVIKCLSLVNGRRLAVPIFD